MNKLYLPVALAAILALQACNQGSQSGSGASNAAAPALDTSEQRLSYGIAYGLGQRLSQDGLPLDVAAFTAGLSDGAAGREAQLSDEEIASEMMAYQQKQMAEREVETAAQAELNATQAEAFLAENAQKDGVTVLPSGLQYSVIEQGQGPIPGPGDTVEVHYRGTLIDGTVFDSSYDRGQTVSFGVQQVIDGWTEALQLMPVGSKWQLAIPSELAYGAGGAGGVIGPNAALLFDVELISIAGNGDEPESAPQE
jgi:FKBP-type peptidyl-prolyl cis-trans isomerase